MFLINIILISILVYYHFKRYPFGINFAFNLGAFFYFIPNLLNVVLGDNNLHISDYTFQVYNFSIFIFVITWNAFGIYYNKTYSEIAFQNIRINITVCYYILIVFLGIYVVGIIGTIGVKDYFSLNRALFYEMKKDIPAFLEIFLNFAAVIFFIIIYKQLKSGKDTKKTILFFISFLILVLFPTGSRGKLISVLLGIIFLLSYFKKINSRKILLPTIFAGVLFQIFGKVRHLTSDPLLIIAFLKENFTWQMLDLSKGESQANLNVFNHIFNEGNIHHYGYFLKSVFDSVQLLIPGFLYDRSFIGLNSWFVKAYFPEIYAAGGGKAFSVLAEGIMNGGLFGVFIITALASTILLLASIALKNLSGRQYVIIFHASLLFDVFQLPRTYYGSFLKQIFIMVLIPLTFIFIANYVLKKK